MRWAKGSTTVENGIVGVAWENGVERFKLIVSAPCEYMLNITLPKEIMYRKNMTVNGKERPAEQNFSVKGSVTVAI
jgi:hypothetical protein